MRTHLIHLFGITMLLGALVAQAAPVGASAAPAITPTPAQTPAGGMVTVAGSGFAPNAALRLFGKAAASAERVRLWEGTAGTDGSFSATFRVAGFYTAAPLPLVVVSVPDNADLAQATVTVTDAPSLATEKLAIAPADGPAGTRFAATGEGFAPGSRVLFHTTETAKGPRGNHRVVADVRIPADGRVAFDIDTAGYSQESHDLVAFTDGVIIGYPLIRAVLALTPGAAPALTVAPTTLPRGGAASATGTGFTPGAKLQLVLLLPQFGGAPVKLANLTIGADGGFTAPVKLNGTIVPGPTPLIVADGPTELARTILTVTDAPSIATERLAVTPDSGAVGTRFAATGEGLTPGQEVVLFTTESAKGPQGNFRQIARLTVPADGRITTTIDSTGYTIEAYDLILFGPGGPEVGLPQAVTSFTVLAATPGLPNTGGGAAQASGAGMSGWALAVLIVAAVAGGGFVAARRRGAAR